MNIGRLIIIGALLLPVVIVAAALFTGYVLLVLSLHA